MKALCALLMTLTLLTGCLKPGTNPTPQVAPHIAGAAAAVNAYCANVSDADTEVTRICATYLPSVNLVAGAAETALNLIFSVLARREAIARSNEAAVRGLVECHN